MTDRGIAEIEPVVVFRAIGNRRRGRILAALRDGQRTTPQIANRVGLRVDNVIIILRELRDLGLVERIGHPARGRPGVHRLIRPAFGAAIDWLVNLGDTTRDASWNHNAGGT